MNELALWFFGGMHEGQEVMLTLRGTSIRVTCCT